MSVPSTQAIAGWIKDEISNTEFLLLGDVAFPILCRHLTRYSEGAIWEMIEEKLEYIANHLRDEAAACRADGVPLRFEIDNEQSPYIKAFPAENELLLKLRSINPLAVERVCAEILIKLGANADVVGGAGDGGVDFTASDLDIMPAGFGIPAVCRATVIGQTNTNSHGSEPMRPIAHSD